MGGVVSLNTDVFPEVYSHLHISEEAFMSLAGDNLELAGGLYAVQNQLKLKIHIGARTALELKGYGHYLGPGIRKILLC